MAIDKYSFMNNIGLGSSYGCGGDYSLSGQMSSLASSMGASYQDIAWFQQAVYGLGLEGNGERAAKKQTLVNLGADLVMNFAGKIFGGGGGTSNATGKAKQKKEEGDKKIKEQGEKQETKMKELNSKMQKLADDSAATAKKIEDTLKTISDKEKQKTELQQKLNEQKKIVEESKQKLQDKNSSRSDRKAAKEALKNAGAAIADLSSEVESLAKANEGNTKELEEQQTENEDINANAVDLNNEIKSAQTAFAQQGKNLQAKLQADYAKSITKTEAELAKLQAKAAVEGATTAGVGTALNAKKMADLTGALTEYNNANSATPGLIDTTLTKPLGEAVNEANQAYTAYIGSYDTNTTSINSGFDQTNSIGSYLTNAGDLKGIGDSITQAADQIDEGEEGQGDDSIPVAQNINERVATGLEQPQEELDKLVSA